jgi:hypothetical protein
LPQVGRASQEAPAPARRALRDPSGRRTWHGSRDGRPTAVSSGSHLSAPCEMRPTAIVTASMAPLALARRCSDRCSVHTYAASGPHARRVPSSQSTAVLAARAPDVAGGRIAVNHRAQSACPNELPRKELAWVGSAGRSFARSFGGSNTTMRAITPARRSILAQRPIAP